MIPSRVNFILKTLAVSLPMLFSFSAQAVLTPYTYADTFDVGYMQIWGDGVPGAILIHKKDNSNFPNCTASANQLWRDPTVTADAAKSMLAVLLTARALNSKVTAYYSKRADGVCLYTIIGLQ